MKIRALICFAFVLLAGCRTEPLNPPRLVGDEETEASIQLFIQASIFMLRAYGFETIPYDQIQFRTQQAGFRALPLMPPTTVRAVPRLIRSMSESPVYTPADVRPLVKYYIRTGLRASQLICRNHMIRMDEGNQYVEFLKKEFGVFSTFSSGVLAIVNANATLTKSFLVATTGINDGLDAFEEYRFLTIDRDSAFLVVQTAQNKFAEYFLKQVDQATIDNNVAVGGYTFSDALHAVSQIEYQCTREGIRLLLNRSVNNTPPNLEIDAATGTVMFKATTDQTPGTGPDAPPVKPAKKKG